MAKQKSKKKQIAQHKQKVEKQSKLASIPKPNTEIEARIVADQETDVVGNNGEPQAPEVNEDAQKDAEMVRDYDAIEEIPNELEAGLNQEGLTLDPTKIEPFDPKSAIADILKKHGA